MEVLSWHDSLCRWRVDYDHAMVESIEQAASHLAIPPRRYLLTMAPHGLFAVKSSSDLKKSIKVTFLASRLQAPAPKSALLRYFYHNDSMLFSFYCKITIFDKLIKVTNDDCPHYSFSLSTVFIGQVRNQYFIVT